MLNTWIQSHIKTLAVLFSFLIPFYGNLLQAQSITNAMWNFSFEPPKGWKYQKDMNGVMLGHDTVPGLILLFPHELKTMQALSVEMRKGLSEDEGYLQLKGKLHKIGKNGFVGDYTGIYQMQEVKAKGYGTLSAHGGGVIVIGMSTPQAYSKQLVAAGNAIIKSVRYKKINKSNMTQYFVGKWSTYTKYSETHIYFYSNGTYKNSSSSSYGNSDSSMGVTWGTAGNNNNRGRWQVEGNMKGGQITLIGNNGTSSYIDYKIQGPKMYFNGTLYGFSSP